MSEVVRSDIALVREGLIRDSLAQIHKKRDEQIEFRRTSGVPAFVSTSEADAWLSSQWIDASAMVGALDPAPADGDRPANGEVYDLPF